MNRIRITPEERATGTLAEESLREAVRALRQDGFVILEDAVDPAHLEILRDRMLQDLPTILERPDAPYNFHAGNVQQDPPPFPPYLFRDILVNEQVIAVTSSLLGSGVRNAYYSGNTALPGGRRQPVHPDVGQLWPGLEQATPAFGLVVNVPVVDTTPENGSTEIWPGTHLDTTYSVGQGAARISEEALAPHRAARPPIQPEIRAGSVVIRDMRLWHAGMPNHTDRARPMIAMIHWVRWWKTRLVPFAAGTEAFFEHPVLKTEARFVEGPIPYLQHNAAYDYKEE